MKRYAFPLFAAVPLPAVSAKRRWLLSMENLPSNYDLEDVFKSVRAGLSSDGLTS
jgi:hypothetical protein